MEEILSGEAGGLTLLRADWLSFQCGCRIEMNSDIEGFELPSHRHGGC